MLEKGTILEKLGCTNRYFVTSEQTLGCLISCTYEWPSGEEALSIMPKQDLSSKIRDNSSSFKSLLTTYFGVTPQIRDYLDDKKTEHDESPW